MEKPQKYSISAFFPMYNDAGTVELMVTKLTQVLKRLTKDYEIIMVDDCSPDDSGKIADSLAKKDPKLKVIHHEKNKGYGGALKSGFENATKDLVFYTDGDAQYDVLELEELYKYIDQYDVVNGYKINRADGVHRKVIGWIYNTGMHLAFNLKVKDIDCDFRLMHRKVFDKVELETDTGMICVEMMKKIQDAGFIIKNVPVHHYDRTYGSSQFLNIKRVAKTLKGLSWLWVDLVLLGKQRKKNVQLQKQL